MLWFWNLLPVSRVHFIVLCCGFSS